MARFISRSKNYSHGIQDEVSEPFANGTKRVLTKGLEAKFEPRGVKPHEIEEASRRLHFKGIPEDKDTRRDVSPVPRLSLFDSEVAAKRLRWTEEEHELVVQTLRESDRNGQDFVEVLPVKVPAPWAGYDNLNDADRIAELALETETVAAALAYERDNQKREDVLEALTGLLETVEQEIVLQG